MEGEWSCYGGCHFNGGTKVMSEGQMWRRENSNVMEVENLKKGEWLLYRWPV